MLIYPVPAWFQSSESRNWRGLKGGGPNQAVNTRGYFLTAEEPSSNTSIQWRTGSVVPLWMCARQPILAVTMVSGPPDSRAVTLFPSNCCDRFLLRME